MPILRIQSAGAEVTEQLEAVGPLAVLEFIRHGADETAIAHSNVGNLGFEIPENGWRDDLPDQNQRNGTEIAQLRMDIGRAAVAAFIREIGDVAEERLQLVNHGHDPALLENKLI